VTYSLRDTHTINGHCVCLSSLVDIRVELLTNCRVVFTAMPLYSLPSFTVCKVHMFMPEMSSEREYFKLLSNFLTCQKFD